jgi:hypothetical protein
MPRLRTRLPLIRWYPLRNWPVPLFVALACVPPLALVLPGPESERQLAPEVPLALAVETALHNSCARAAATGRGPKESCWEW